MARITLRQLLDHAASQGYAVPAFNINNMEQGIAIMQAAAEVDAPVIIQASRGARSYAGDLMLYVLHNIAELDVDPPTAGFAAVIYGHSHQPSIETRDGVLYLNPGSAGPRRFSLPISLARITVDGPALTPELVTLTV